MQDWIPRPDALALEFMQTFATTIAGGPASYMLTPADATAISNVVNLFAAAQTVAVTPGTRTSLTIAARDDARASATSVVRQYGKLIKYNAGITDTAKMAIGVRPVNPSRQPVNVPGTPPQLNVVAATLGAQTVRFLDSVTERKAKPLGALMLQLYVAVAENNTEDPNLAKFHGNYAVSPIPVIFDFPDRGKQATYFARWANQRNEVGPWSLPVSLSIAA